MDINTAFPSKWIEAADLAGKTKVLVMEDVTLEEVGDDKEQRPVVWFRNQEKGMVLNKTNAGTIVKLYGSETDEWSGKPIAIYPTETAFRGEMVPCIRVKSERPKKRSNSANGRSRD